jgi:uncharacterized membrane protein
MIKSKRFWLNVVTAITMLGAVVGGLDLDAEQAKVITFIVAFANIILQVWFNKEVSPK